MEIEFIVMYLSLAVRTTFGCDADTPFFLGAPFPLVHFAHGHIQRFENIRSRTAVVFGSVAHDAQQRHVPYGARRRLWSRP